MGGEHFSVQIIAWELTRRCELACAHCRAGASLEPDPEELTTEEVCSIIRSIAGFSRPLLILSGGDPVLRDDLFEIIHEAKQNELRVVMAPTGANLAPELVTRMKQSGIERVSISIDGATPRSHDLFRGRDGIFELVMRGIECLREGGMPFQINTTITRKNKDELPDIYQLTKKIGALALHAFLLVPVGRGEGLKDWEISPKEYEEVLGWIAGKEKEGDLELKATCAPHYYRILKQRGIPTRNPRGQGCLGGKSYAFISSRGKVQICGYLPLEAGDLRQSGYDFRSIWEHSDLFQAVRNTREYRGKCGKCEYRNICGGCRARAYSFSGDFLQEEPFCSYIPQIRERGEER